MKISAKSKDYRLVVTVKTSSKEIIDEKELDRFNRQYLRCFLKSNLIKKNVIEYTGPVGISLQERMKKGVSKRDFFLILEHMVVAILKLQSNSFPLNFLRMHLENIYINEVTKELQFLYIPVNSEDNNSNVMDMIRSVVYTACPIQEPDMDYVSRFSYFFEGLKPFDVNALEQFIQREDPAVVAAVRKQNAGQSGYMTSSRKKYQDHLDAIQNVPAAPVAPATPVKPVTPVVPAAPVAPVKPVVPPVQKPAYNDEATGLLYESAPYVPEPVAPAESVVLYQQEAPAPALQLAYNDEATGLLYESTPYVPEPVAPAESVVLYQQEAPAPAPQPTFNDEATGVLYESTPYVPEPAAPAEPVVLYQQEVTAPVPEAVSRYAEPVYQPEPEHDVEETTLLRDTEETTLLVEPEPEPEVDYPKLRRVSTGEVVSINKPVFRVGKDRNFVDYFVANNSAVSRSHADIVIREHGCFVIDLNSTNRTYINNIPLVVQTETPIKDGDKLRLGNEEFEFFEKDVPAQLHVCPKCGKQLQNVTNFCIFCGSKL